jgi:hypothetical protein
MSHRGFDRRDFLRRCLFGGVTLAVSGSVIEQLCAHAAKIAKIDDGFAFASHLGEEVTIIDTIEGPATIEVMEVWCHDRGNCYHRSVNMKLERVDRPGVFLDVDMSSFGKFMWMCTVGYPIVIAAGETAQMIATTRSQDVEVCGYAGPLKWADRLRRDVTSEQHRQAATQRYEEKHLESV